MKQLVAVKRVVDYNVKIRLRPDQRGVDTSNVKMSINPFCEIALEQAIRFKEQGKASEIVAVTVGDTSAQEVLRHALALGADRAIHVQTDRNTDHDFDSLAIAKILQQVVQQEQPDLVWLGKQAIDDDNNQTGQMLAALLDWPQGTFASAVEPQDGRLLVTREVDAGLETLSMTLPAVVTVDLRLNEPRYASLPNIMKAKRKPIDVLALSSLGLELESSQKVLKVLPPPVKQGGIKVTSVEELVDKLRNEAKVL